jgi:hypothetical protein
MYDAKVLEVLIASPSDTREQREAIKQAVIYWNSTESRFLGVVLLPVMWETHTYPDFGQPAQQSINKQIVDDADILIATFWTTLGTPTTDAESGTVEEISRFRTAGKHVLLYFCEMPTAPLDNDATALEALRAYKEQVKKEALFSSFRNIEELKTKVRDDLTKLIHDKGDGGDFGSPSPSDNPQGPSGDQPRDVGKALTELRSEFRGYLAKWEAVFHSLEDDYSVDKRQTLASEIEHVTLEVLRLASTEAPDAPFIAELSRIASEAHGVSTTRVYMDGGISFGKLTEGCRTLLASISTLVAGNWGDTGANNS